MPGLYLKLNKHMPDTKVHSRRGGRYFRIRIRTPKVKLLPDSFSAEMVKTHCVVANILVLDRTAAFPILLIKKVPVVNTKYFPDYCCSICGLTDPDWEDPNRLPLLDPDQCCGAGAGRSRTF